MFTNNMLINYIFEVYMAYKELLSDEDWAVLEASVASIFKIIAGADGKVDKKEQTAIASVIANSRKLKDSLAKEVLETIETPDDLLLAFEKQKLSPKEILRKAAFILDNKIEPKDGLTYKKHLVAIGVYIGNASGSLFDYNMSHDEMDALREAGAALNISVKDLEQTNIILDIINSISE